MWRRGREPGENPLLCKISQRNTNNREAKQVFQVTEQARQYTVLLGSVFTSISFKFKHPVLEEGC